MYCYFIACREMLRNINVALNGHKHQLSVAVISEVAFLDSVLYITENVSRNKCSVLGGSLEKTVSPVTCFIWPATR